MISEGVRGDSDARERVRGREKEGYKGILNYNGSQQEKRYMFVRNNFERRMRSNEHKGKNGMGKREDFGCCQMTTKVRRRKR